MLNEERKGYIGKMYVTSFELEAEKNTKVNNTAIPFKIKNFWVLVQHSKLKPSLKNLTILRSQVLQEAIQTRVQGKNPPKIVNIKK